jgi:antitoxin component YwqK of YwqJK toxin-antitoxin module
VNGLQEGPARDWYASGRLRSETMFHKGVGHGHDRRYREDGSVESESSYEFGVHTRSVVFDESGHGRETFVLAEGSLNHRLLQRLRAQHGE